MSTRDEVRIGIAGLGHRAIAWIRMLQRIPGYRIVALCDWILPRQEVALAEVADRDDVQVFSDYEEFLACEGMDAVGLTARRKDMGAMAAQARKLRTAMGPS